MSLFQFNIFTTLIKPTFTNLTIKLQYEKLLNSNLIHEKDGHLIQDIDVGRTDSIDCFLYKSAKNDSNKILNLKIKNDEVNYELVIESKICKFLKIHKEVKINELKSVFNYCEDLDEVIKRLENKLIVVVNNDRIRID
ncbi:hypothetical protein HERIO_235 [Hepatospora eriocheir]|uniref:Uncharacterized protein n=1 Tax=Hepatospora eriocheir TaxID=1081669 RepID=A0A1X0QDM1_9MICR|nr:hypothetical protein HERIO_235 [Hepatospora eriocheir]